jgi:hypothetical protein
MHYQNKTIYAICFLIILSLVTAEVSAQEEKKKEKKEKGLPHGTAVMWESVNIEARDLIAGPGGEDMRPDVSRIEFIEEEKGGYNKKYRIKDAAGRVWVAKAGREAQPETAAVRLLWGLGYKTEINYLVPKLTIPGHGDFENIRLEARPKDVERMGRWSWEDNPFKNSDQLQGLKIIMAMFNNWDIRDGNNVILQKGDEHYYAVSDLGATFGKVGSNNLPVFWRLGRSIGKPESYSESDFIKEIESGRIEFSFKGRGRKIFEDITVSHGRWTADLMMKLSDKQIEDAFRAANYPDGEIKILAEAVKAKITALDRATRQGAVGTSSF